MKAKLLLLLAPALLMAQDKGGSTTIYPGPAYNEVKQYLSLTDAQVQSLTTIQNNRLQAQSNIYTQISKKYQALYDLMNAGTGTAAQLGQYLLDIQALQKQLPAVDGPYKAQAQNVLTTEQKAKLPKLVEALQLQATASQAAGLLLIDYPDFRGQPIPVDFTGAASSAGATGPEILPLLRTPAAQIR